MRIAEKFLLISLYAGAHSPSISLHHKEGTMKSKVLFFLTLAILLAACAAKEPVNIAPFIILGSTETPMPPTAVVCTMQLPIRAETFVIDLDQPVSFLYLDLQYTVKCTENAGSLVVEQIADAVSYTTTPAENLQVDSCYSLYSSTDLTFDTSALSDVDNGEVFAFVANDAGVITMTKDDVTQTVTGEVVFINTPCQ